MSGAWPTASCHFSPGLCLMFIVPQTHHNSSGLFTYAQAVPADGNTFLAPSAPDSYSSFKASIRHQYEDLHVPHSHLQQNRSLPPLGCLHSPNYW